MSRRRFVALAAAALAAPWTALAQPAKRVYRIAILDEASKDARPHEWAVFQDRLREHRLVEGKTVQYERRFARGQNELIPGLASELVASKPDLIVCGGTPSTRAAMKATQSIPIIFAAAGDPVGTGLVTSLSRPGGNVTGFAVSAPETAQKLLEILRELSPGLQRVAFINDASNPGTFAIYGRLEETARKLKMGMQMLDGAGQAALERSFATIRKDRIQALIVGNAGALLDYREQIIQYAAREKLLVGSGRRDYIESGGLVYYGIDRRPLFRAAANLAQRILQGAKPADIPVEQVAVIRTMLNLKTARALGLKIPESVRARVDEVIE